MAKAEFALRTIAKSALIWLTAALLFASLFGALLSARPNRLSLSIAEPGVETVLATDESDIAR